MAELIAIKGSFEIQARRILDRTKKVALQKSLEAGIKSGLLGKFADSVAYRLPRLVRVHGLTPEFTEKILDLTRQNMVPEGVLGHFSHLDHVIISHFCHELIDLTERADLGQNLKGFVETLAKSNPDGKQSKFIQGVYATMEAYVSKRGLNFVAITRDEDVERYNMVKMISDKRPLVSATRQKGIGVLVPAGGSIQPGRHPKGAKGDKIFGLQEIKDTDILDVFDLMERSGKRIDQEPYFLPVAINRTYRIYSSDSLLPTPEGLISLYDISSRSFGLFGFKRMVATITPAMPLTTEDMASKLGSAWRSNPKDTIDFLMTEVARKLPPNARGYYGKFVKEELFVV